jgi:hypothetical protein
VLIIDGMKIRKQLCWDPAHKAACGHADGGDLFDCSDASLATEAVVVMATNLRESWKLPAAYMLLDSVKPVHQCAMLTRTIAAMNKVGATVRALVCDGSSVNLSTVR